jgi:diaminohydroxyphosphoribosylaminopyrimidine deaminase / 5-amino-6-(5-phosphoribosylamino)uracil reductase
LKLFLGIKDPNPLIQERNGLEEVKNLGIQIIFDDEIQYISDSFLTGFIKRITTKKPRFIVKTAVSKNDMYSLRSREKFQISNSISKEINHLLRAKVDAIVVGPATTYFDEPILNSRDLHPVDDLDIDFGSDPFFHALLNTIQDRNELAYISNLNHQPDRIFCISNKYFPKEIFFKNQTQLEDVKGRTIFVVLDSLSEDKMNLLNNLKFKNIFFLKNKTIYDLIIEMTNQFLWNNVMIEGGGFLYNEFLPRLTNGDLIVKIISQKTILDGILFPDTLIINHIKLFSFFAGDDYWQISKIN